MPRRRKLPPDTRPKWDDPDLRVRRRCTDGSWIEITAEQETRRAQASLTQAEVQGWQFGIFSWRDDPTYDLKRRKQ